MKLKTHSGAKKRFKRTGTGKLLRKKAGRRHLLTGKGRDRKRRLKGSAVVSSTFTMAVNRILP
ncbi:MAG TPA: 50S ribosomal protein L35 [Nitrospiraceae bacterium]|jgi:large subunit ribosomal protein L35|nr:50S ribosomal protein L35 [Nitrospiraceae bacterium]